MQTMVSDKTFHLKWNNHLQNLSQLFTTIYSSSALADVTLSCRDGTIKAHKLVLSACSPYFEQIFKDNPCQHPIVILKGIPFSEINLLVEFMYKGSVDVQELDLQSLMHTASELEIRGLAYEARDNAAQMLNVNLEYPSYPSTTVNAIPQQQPQGFPQARTDVERLKQIHMYQQSMMRAEELRRRRRDEPSTHTAVNNILAAAAREMEEARNAGGRSAAGIQTDAREVTGTSIKTEMDDERPKKRMSILTSEEERLKAKKKPQMTVRFQDEVKMDERPNKITSPGAAIESKCDENKSGGIKVVQLSALQKPQANDDDSDEREKSRREDDDEETDSSGSVSDSGANDSHEGRPHVCDICDVRFQRASHLSRHRLTHTGERPFTCGGCGRSFARSDKLRVHTKICERDDPTVDMSNDTAPTPKRETSSEVMSGMVRTTHRESGHLVFTASGDVMLPPRQPVLLNAQLEEREAAGGGNGGGGGGATAAGDTPRRGRGRPRKTPLPLTPKIKKRRGRPPKTSLDGMEGCVLTSGSMLAVGGGGGGGGGGGTLGSPAQHQLLLKRRRGRPPKNYMLGAGGEFQNLPFGLSVEVSKTYGRPNENYNATNLPFGDFSYLTDMMYIPTLQQFAYQQQQSQPTPAPPTTDDSLLDNSEVSTPADSTHERTIDVSDSETDEDEHPNVEPEENVPPVAMETQIMTVGDCQIVKLPNMDDDKNEVVDNNVPASTGSVTITPIKTVGDCTIRPVENNT